MSEGVPLSGQIDPLGFPFLLMDLHRQGATGSLRVDGPTYQKALYFRGGRILFASSNDPRDQLGAILIEKGVLNPEQLEDATSKVGQGSPLAKVLSETGFVSQRELSEAAATKVERILSEVLAYTSGSFEFEDGVLPKGAVDLKLSTERLVIAAVRHVADRAYVLRHLGGLDVVLAPVRERQEYLPQAETWAWEVMAQFDGRSTLKEAAAGTRLDEFEVAKIACALLFLGIVERRDASLSTETAFAIVDDAPEIDLSDTVRAVLTTPASPATPTPEPSEPAMTMPEPEPEPQPEPPAPSPAVPAILGHEVVSRTPAPAPPPRPASLTTTPARPAKDDLAALDILLNPRATEGPLASLDMPAVPPPRGPAVARRPAADRGRQDAPSPARRLVPLAALVAVVATAGWWFLGRRSSMTADSPPRPITAPPSTTPPMTTVAATAPPSTTAPATARPAPTAADDLAAARRLLAEGDLTASARGFAAHLGRAPAGTATVQLLVACSNETVQKAVANTDAAQIVIVPVDYRGRACYRLCWGVYASEEQALAAVGSLPGYFRKGGATPRVVAAAAILP